MSYHFIDTLENLLTAISPIALSLHVDVSNPLKATTIFVTSHITYGNEYVENFLSFCWLILLRISSWVGAYFTFLGPGLLWCRIIAVTNDLEFMKYKSLLNVVNDGYTISIYLMSTIYWSAFKVIYICLNADRDGILYELFKIKHEHCPVHGNPSSPLKNKPLPLEHIR